MCVGVCVCVCVCVRERERERDTHTDIQKQKQRQTDTQTDRETETEREGGRIDSQLKVIPLQNKIYGVVIQILTIHKKGSTDKLVLSQATERRSEADTEGPKCLIHLSLSPT